MGDAVRPGDHRLRCGGVRRRDHRPGRRRPGGYDRARPDRRHLREHRVRAVQGAAGRGQRGEGSASSPVHVSWAWDEIPRPFGDNQDSRRRGAAAGVRRGPGRGRPPARHRRAEPAGAGRPARRDHYRRVPADREPADLGGRGCHRRPAVRLHRRAQGSAAAASALFSAERAVDYAALPRHVHQPGRSTGWPDRQRRDC